MWALNFQEEYLVSMDEGASLHGFIQFLPFHPDRIKEENTHKVAVKSKKVIKCKA